MLSCIIVDDESDCREALSMLIKKFCPNLRLLATADGVKSAVRTIKQYKPDLVFLDIEMPDGSGFNL
ncbi:MAG: LytR/AlgR family response regulator transcription factor, partial [Chitinophagales bacterium]